MESKLCPTCESRHLVLRGGMWMCWHCDDDTRNEVSDEPIIISRQVAWFCPNCDEQNFTDLPFECATCSECSNEYSAFLVGSLEGSYEQTLDSDGNFDADVYVPDIPDENEPGVDHYHGYDDYGLG